jgi:hypothetical protein
MTLRSEPPPIGQRAAWRPLFLALAAAILTCQLLLGLWGADDALTRGHNGFNSAAYLQAARNSLRWQELLPHQDYTGAHPPPVSHAYTHAPLAAHLHNVAAVWLFGDHTLSVRGVAALHAWLVTCALLVVVSAHWSLAHGVLAAAFYTIAPINAIYLNMVNHSAGFQFWSIAMLHCYLRVRQRQRWPWFVGLLLSAWFACSWDWPAYYVAFCLALHWLGCWLDARRRAQSELASPRLLAYWAAFCAWILLNFAAFLAVLHWAAEGSGDLFQTLGARQNAHIDFWRSARIVPSLLFTLPVLAVCAGWLGELAFRCGHGRARARDLLPCAFAAAGGVHYFLFRDSATVHEYWLWPALPFVAFALADFVVRGSARWRAMARTRGRYDWALRAAVLALLALPPVSLLARSAELVPRGRQVGGSLWFVANTRGPTPSTYDSGRAELRFADRVRAWTDRETGVLIDDALDLFRLEPRFDITLDREVRRVKAGAITPAPAQGIRGWVYIGTTATQSTDAVLARAGEHPVTFYDHYFMIDLRRRERSVGLYRLARAESSLGYRLLQSSFEPHLREVRDREAEDALALRRARPGS